SRHYYDGGEWMSRIALEGNYLEAEEFLRLALALETVAAIKSFLLKRRETCPALCALADPLSVTSALTDKIHQKIDDKATVRDGATPELGRIRRKLRE